MPVPVWLAAVWIMSSLTLTTGVGAGVVYTPLLVLGAGLDLRAAVATSIVIQIAGVGATAIGHLRSGFTDFGLAWWLGGVATGGVVLGAVAADFVPLTLTAEIYAVGFVLVGIWLVATRRAPLPMGLASRNARRRRAEARVVAGETYDFCRPSHGYGLSTLAGVATTVLGISGAEIQITALMLRCGVPVRIAVTTGTVATTVSLAAAVGFLGVTAGRAVAFAGWGIPAAIAGSVTARRVARHLPREGIRLGVGLLVLVSAVGLAYRGTTPS